MERETLKIRVADRSKCQKCQLYQLYRNKLLEENDSVIDAVYDMDDFIEECSKKCILLKKEG